MTVGDRIKEIRLAKGMTQEELAIACGYQSRSTINKVEKEVSETRLSTIKKIAKALNVDPDYLVFGDADDKKKEIETLISRLSETQQTALLAYLRTLTEER